MKYLHSLSGFELWHHVHVDGRTSQQIFTRGGRTGKKVHTATAGSSCLGCGHWTRHNVGHFQVTAAQADQMQRCEKCFGGKWLEVQQ